MLFIIKISIFKKFSLFSFLKFVRVVILLQYANVSRIRYRSFMTRCMANASRVDLTPDFWLPVSSTHTKASNSTTSIHAGGFHEGSNEHPFAPGTVIGVFAIRYRQDFSISSIVSSNFRPSDTIDDILSSKFQPDDTIIARYRDDIVSYRLTKGGEQIRYIWHHWQNWRFSLAVITPPLEILRVIPVPSTH